MDASPADARMHGTVCNTRDNTDLLLAFGVRFDDRTNRQNRGIREEGKLTTAGGGDGGERRRHPSCAKERNRRSDGREGVRGKDIERRDI